jgi:hypothetical protein
VRFAVLRAFGVNEEKSAIEVDLGPTKACGFVASKRDEQQEADEVAHRLVCSGGPTALSSASYGTWSRALPGFGRSLRSRASHGL